MLAGGPTESQIEAASPWWWNHSVSVESGLLWQVGVYTPISYRLVPTQLSWRSRGWWGHEFAGGARVVIKHRFALIGTWVQEGPELFYTGVMASPSIEVWNTAGTWGLNGGVGGGVGWIDSRGTPGGQGQDFTLNWFARVGLERKLGERQTVSVGVLFKHLSNGGQTDPNPGIDALGLSIGWSRYY